MTVRASRVRRLASTGAITLAATVMLAQPAAASANVEGLLQNVVDMLTGNTARLLAGLLTMVQASVSAPPAGFWLQLSSETI